MVYDFIFTDFSFEERKYSFFKFKIGRIIIRRCRFMEKREITSFYKGFQSGLFVDKPIDNFLFSVEGIWKSKANFFSTQTKKYFFFAKKAKRTEFFCLMEKLAEKCGFTLRIL